MKKKLKGFTLIELIVVMAIFSIIMFTALAMIKPVSDQFDNTVQYENSRATLDNVRLFIENNLKYADRVQVYTGFDSLPTDVTDGTVGDTNGLSLTATNTGGYNDPINFFRYKYYLMTRNNAENLTDSNNAQITEVDGVTPKTTYVQFNRSYVDSYYDGSSDFRIYEMEIINADTATGDPGKISLNTYEMDGTLVEEKEYAVNEAFFDDYAIYVMLGNKVDVNADGTFDSNDIDPVSGNYQYSEIGAASAALEIEAFERDNIDGTFTISHKTAMRMTATFSFQNVVSNPSETIYAGIKRLNSDLSVVAPDFIDTLADGVTTVDYRYPLDNTTATTTQFLEDTGLASEKLAPYTVTANTFDVYKNLDLGTTNGVAQEGNVYIVFTLPKAID